MALHAFEIDGVDPVGTDFLIDVDVLPNRSSDCLSHRGIAREIAALLKTDLVEDPLRTKVPVFPLSERVKLRIDADRCTRYIAVLIEGVKIAPSPEWLKQYLETLGQRSINNVVDATNYVMLNLGQPLHAFDVGKLGKDASGAVAVGVRMARDGEKMMTLSGEELIVTSDDVVIIDTTNDAIIGLAGVKGGKSAEVAAGTTSILIESAHFDFVSVRRTSRRHKLVTDASVRFQNEPSPALTAYAARDVTKLILEIAGGSIIGSCEVKALDKVVKPVSVTSRQVSALLGIEVSDEVLRDVFSRLDFAFKVEGETFTVTPPFERTDIHSTEDLIEEVGRIHGYEHVQSMVPPSTIESKRNKQYEYQNLVRDVLVGLGFSEVLTYALRSRGEVELENPLTDERRFLRKNLADGLLEVAAHNEKYLPLLGDGEVKIFEIGSVFPTKGEHVSLGLTVTGKGREKLLADALTALEMALKVPLNASVSEGAAEVDFDSLLTKLQSLKEVARYPFPKAFVQHKPFSMYPFALRDVAVWTPTGTTAETVEDVIRASAGPLAVRIRLFDRFEKEGRISYAFNLVFQSDVRTLTDIELDTSMKAITGALNSHDGWAVR